MRTSSVVMVALFTVCSVTADTSTNVPAPFSTKAPGVYHLDRPWVGESRTVVQTGLFSGNANSNELEKLERVLRFDSFTVRDKSSADQPGKFSLSESKGRTKDGWLETMFHVYRLVLPSDAAIQACSTVPNLADLLGEPHETDGAPYAASWRFFTFTPSNTIETLSVFCVCKQWKGPVDGLTIRRGIAKQSE